MYLEHDASRLRSLVVRTATGLRALPVDDRERALAALYAVIYGHALDYRGEAFADHFAALFLQAVRARIDD
jgi:hypothetical protein